MDQEVEVRFNNLKRAPTVWGADARRGGVPTPSYPGPQTVPLARRTQPRRAARYKKWQFPQWKLDGGNYRGAKVATSVGESIWSRDVSRA